MMKETRRCDAGRRRLMAMVALCALNLLYVHYYVLLNYGVEIQQSFPVFADNVCGVFIDLCCLGGVALLLCRGRLRPALGLAFVVTFVWSFCNVLYSRFFMSYISLSSMGQAGTLFDWLMLKCMIDGLRWSDLYYVVCPVVFGFLYSTAPRRATGFRGWGRRAAMGFALLVVADLGAHLLFCLQDAARRYPRYYTGLLYDRHVGTSLFMCGPRFSNFTRGFVRTLACELWLNMQGAQELTPGQRQQILAAIDEARSSMLPVPQDTTTRNVIFILVESYMAFTSDLVVDGQEITPCLNALKHDSATYYNGRIHPNITIGESGDGQFIYMTGLLPLRSIVTISRAYRNTLPGLAKVLGEQRGLQSRMVIPTVTTMWNQDKMSRGYGFDHLYSSADYQGDHDSNLNDEQVFRLAAQLDGASQQPFFSVVLTMSMHQPYQEEVDADFHLADASLTTAQRCYLNACHYTDRQIGRYLEHLKAKGLYDNTLIVIAADHHVAKVSPRGDDCDECHNTPLYVVNSPLAGKVPMWQGDCQQIDVYPTLLNLLGIEAPWYGLGHSLLGEDYRQSLLGEKWDVSEWMILGDYFSL